MNFSSPLGFNHSLDLFSRKTSDEQSDIITHFHTPVTTSTSVLGLAFEDGVILAADILASYGSLARFKNCPRVLKVNNQTMIGVGGDYADYQYLKEMIDSKIVGEECLEDNIFIKPASLHCWLTRVLYNRRSKIDPLWNNVIVAGLQKDAPFLGAVDKLGTAYTDNIIGTGYGAYIAVPLIRAAVEKNRYPLTQEKAKEIMMKCMEILYYRDARSSNKYQLGIITSQGCEIIGPLSVKANWDIAREIHE